MLGGIVGEGLGIDNEMIKIKILPFANTAFLAVRAVPPKVVKSATSPAWFVWSTVVATSLLLVGAGRGGIPKPG